MSGIMRLGECSRRMQTLHAVIGQYYNKKMCLSDCNFINLGLFVNTTDIIRHLKLLR